MLTNSSITLYDAQVLETSTAGPDEHRTCARTKWLWIVPGIATLLAGISWACNGIAPLTDAAWMEVLSIGLIYSLRELWVFPTRGGIGAAVLFLSLIFWYGMDYVLHWSSWSAGQLNITAVVGGTTDIPPHLIAKTSFYHLLFATMMCISLSSHKGNWLPRLLTKIPQPASPNVFLGLIFFLFFFSLIPYFLFTSESWYDALWKHLVMMRSGSADWTVGRSAGALNYSWGGYVVQWLDIGKFAGLLAAFFAIFIARRGIAAGGVGHLALLRGACIRLRHTR